MDDLQSNQLKDKALKKGEKEYFFSQYFHRKISFLISRILMKTSINANQVSLFGLLVGLIACFLFVGDNYYYWIIGAIIYQLFHILDGVDGEIARFKNQCSLFGGLLDGLTHIILNGTLIMTMGLGLYFTYGNFLIIIVGIVGGLSILMTQSIHLITSLFKEKRKNKLELNKVKENKNKSKSNESVSLYASLRKMNKIKSKDNFLMKFIKGWFSFGAFGYIILILMAIEFSLDINLFLSLREWFLILISLFFLLTFIITFFNFLSLSKIKN